MSLFFYNIFLFFLKTGSRLAALFNKKAEKWVSGRINLLSTITSTVKKGDKLVWMHCASLGEFEQGRPILEKIKSDFPSYKILLTFFSPSGYEVRKNYDGADYVFYLPVDSAANARQFLDAIAPSLVIFVKYEFWYYYITEINKRNIPLLLVSAIFRKEQAFFKWYGSLYRNMLGKFLHVFAQDNGSVELLAGIIDRNKTSVAGDTRFDRVTEIANRFEPIAAIEEFCKNKKTIVAGSTWPDDEKVLSEVFEKLTDNSLVLIIAPHEIHEGHIEQLRKIFPSASLYSEGDYKNPESAEKSNVLIIDTVGILSRLYKYAAITYIGGGFTKDGIHNSLEAAVYSKPVLFGPNYKKYREAIELIASGGALSFSSTDELIQQIQSLLNNDEKYKQTSNAAGKYVQENTGATNKIMKYIQENRLLTN